MHLAGIVGDPASKLQKTYNENKFNFIKKCFKFVKNIMFKNSYFPLLVLIMEYLIQKIGNENSKLKPLSLYAKTKLSLKNL